MSLSIVKDEKFLTVSLVIFKPDLLYLRKTLTSLVETNIFKQHDCFLLIVDNSPSSETEVTSLINEFLEIVPGKYITRPDNPGFGASHNLSLSIKSRFTLILNPDLEMDKNALSNAFEFMDAHEDCGLITPYATWGNGETQYLCKRYPSIFVLFLRFFASIKGKRFFHNYMRRYEMADTLTPQEVYWDPPIVSGCFMLFRYSIFEQLSGFNTRFFLYFEDFDISLRAGKITRIAYVPQVKVVHYGGHAARKGWRHIKLFGRSMATFFNIHGWKIF